MTLRTNSRLVVLDVVVLDKNGHPATGLSATDFTVTEDTVPQHIRSFDPPAGHTMPPGSDAKLLVNSTSDLAKIGTAPVNILVFDELNTPFEQVAYAREQMEKYLKAQPEVLPLPTLLVAAGDARFVVLHDYTQSRGDLLQSVHAHFPQYPWQMMRGAGSGNGALERMAQTLGVLGQIADSTRGTPGRKNVIWIGTGYPSIDETKIDDEGSVELTDAIRRITGRLLAARVTLYMVDPAGVVFQERDTINSGDEDSVAAGGTPGLGPYSGKLEFSTFASATGGRVFSGRNDLDAQIKAGIAEGGLYYTLSYSPTNASDDAQQYRRIRVTLKDKSLHAVTRDGYFGGPVPVETAPAQGQKPTGQLKFDIASAAQTTLVYNGLSVQAVPEVNGYLLRITARDLRWSDQPDGSRRAEVTVMAVCFNAKNKELRHEAVELKERIGAQDHIESGVRAGFHVPFRAATGTTRIRFVVRDAQSGVLGSADVQP